MTTDEHTAINNQWLDANSDSSIGKDFNDQISQCNGKHPRNLDNLVSIFCVDHSEFDLNDIIGHNKTQVDPGN